jgi:hypothetical protein
LKHTTIIASLPMPEREEYYRLEGQKRRSPAAQERLDLLAQRANELHRQQQAQPRTADNDLALYAQEVGERMRTRQAGDSESPRLTGS